METVVVGLFRLVSAEFLNQTSPEDYSQNKKYFFLLVLRLKASLCATVCVCDSTREGVVVEGRPRGPRQYTFVCGPKSKSTFD